MYNESRMISHLGIPSLDLYYESIDEDDPLKPGHLYILSHFYDTDNLYWFVYIKSNGSKVFMLKDFEFPYYVNSVKRYMYEGKEFIAFSKGFPEDENDFQYDVVLQESMIQDVKVWLLCKDIDITFPKDNCMYAWFDVKVCHGLAKLSVRKPTVRDVKQYQRPTSLLQYPGCNSECSFFIDFKVLKTPELPQEYKEPIFTNKKLKALESEFSFADQPKTQEQILDEKFMNKIWETFRRNDEEKHRHEKMQEELRREREREREKLNLPTPLDSLPGYNPSVSQTPKPTMKTQIVRPPPKMQRVPVGGTPADDSNEVKNNKPNMKRNT